jgi:hypothetical protein
MVIGLAIASIGLSTLTFLELFAPWQKVSFSYGGFGGISASFSGMHRFGFATDFVLVVLIALSAVALSGAVRGPGRLVVGIVTIGAAALVPLTTIIHIADASSYRTGWQWLGLLLSLGVAGTGGTVGALYILDAKSEIGSLAPSASPTFAASGYAPPPRRLLHPPAGTAIPSVPARRAGGTVQPGG